MAAPVKKRSSVVILAGNRAALNDFIGRRIVTQFEEQGWKVYLVEDADTLFEAMVHPRCFAVFISDKFAVKPFLIVERAREITQTNWVLVASKASTTVNMQAEKAGISAVLIEPLTALQFLQRANQMHQRFERDMADEKAGRLRGAEKRALNLALRESPKDEINFEPILVGYPWAEENWSLKALPAGCDRNGNYKPSPEDSLLELVDHMQVALTHVAEVVGAKKVSVLTLSGAKDWKLGQKFPDCAYSLASSDTSIGHYTAMPLESFIAFRTINDQKIPLLLSDISSDAATTGPPGDPWTIDQKSHAFAAWAVPLSGKSDGIVFCQFGKSIEKKQRQLLAEAHSFMRLMIEPLKSIDQLARSYAIE